MNEKDTYTLAELAEKCGLTERTTRYYIEKVLPPHHKQGRGKLARYGRDTLSSIRFIKLVGDNHGIRPGQARDVLARVPQETIDRVVSGEEELAVMSVPSVPVKMSDSPAGTIPRPSLRAARFMESRPQKPASRDMSPESAVFFSDEDLFMSDAEPEIKELRSYSLAEHDEPWRTVYSNEKVRVQCKGNKKLTEHQEEQVEAASRLIELALR